MFHRQGRYFRSVTFGSHTFSITLVQVNLGLICPRPQKMELTAFIQGQGKTFCILHLLFHLKRQHPLHAFLHSARFLVPEDRAAVAACADRKDRPRVLSTETSRLKHPVDGQRPVNFCVAPEEPRLHLAPARISKNGAVHRFFKKV